MEEKKVRHEIQFNDVEKFERFIMLYGDLFQSLNTGWNANGHGRFGSSSFEGYEYSFIFHMNKENFKSLIENKVVRKIDKASYKSSWLKGYTKRIWVFR